jgi:predicted Zn-dependent protease
VGGQKRTFIMKKEKKSNTKKKASANDYTAAQYIEQANVALSEMQLELAEKMFCRALSKAPDDTNIMDALADVYIQLGEMENALPLLLRSTNLAPLENPYKWFFLGQLQCGSDSIESYRIGINALTLLLGLVSFSPSIYDSDVNMLMSLQPYLNIRTLVMRR